MFNEPIQEAQSDLEWLSDEATGSTASSGAGVKIHGHVVRGSAFMITAVVVGAVGSFAFWLVVARLEPRRVVGTAAALTTVLMFLNYATSLGLAVVVPRYASGPSASARIIFCWAIVATTVSSAVGVVLYAVLAPSSAIQPLYEFAGTPSGLALMFVLLVGFSLATIIDVRMLTLHRWGWLIAKAVFVAVARFPLLLVAPSGSPGVWLFLVAVVPTSLAGFVGGLVLSKGGWALRSVRTETLRSASRFAGVNYIGLLTLQAPTLALPLIVADNVSKADYASFFIAFSITTVIFVVPASVAQVLLAEGKGAGTELVRQIRVARRLSVGVAFAMVLASPVIARVVTFAYGKRYHEASDLVVPLIVAVLAWALTAIYLSEARIGESTAGTLAITASFAAATLLPAFALVDALGLAGVAATWLFGNAVAALVAIVVHGRLHSRAVIPNN